MQWFGESWHAPMCNPDIHCDTPVGAICRWCEEPVDEGDMGVVLPMAMGGVTHRECFWREVIGGVGCLAGHPEGWCDPPRLTARQAARLSCNLFDQLGRSGTARLKFEQAESPSDSEAPYATSAFRGARAGGQSIGYEINPDAMR